MTPEGSTYLREASEILPFDPNRAIPFGKLLVVPEQKLARRIDDPNASILLTKMQLVLLTILQDDRLLSVKDIANQYLIMNYQNEMLQSAFNGILKPSSPAEPRIPHQLLTSTMKNLRVQFSDLSKKIGKDVIINALGQGYILAPLTEAEEVERQRIWDMQDAQKAALRNGSTAVSSIAG